MVKFIIITSQRTGSTFIRKFLDSHPDIRCHGELFISKKTDKHWNDDRFYNYCFQHPLKKMLFFWGLYNLMPQSFTDTFFDNCKGGFKAKGFKLMYNHFRKNKLGYLFERNDLKFIHLVRKNALKKYISSEVARVRKIAHSDRKLPQIAIKINIDQAVKSTQQYIKDVNHFQSILADKDTLEISYEEFFRDPETEIIPILNFLGIPLKKMYCKSQKLTQNDLSQVVENYEALFDKLKGTQFEKFLYM